MPENRKQHPRLDPRDPFVLDTRELGRRPGSMREVRFSAPAPEGFELADLIGVPTGADLELDLRLESVMDGVLVSGVVTAPVSGECGRCLADVSDTLRVKVQELYVYDDSRDHLRGVDEDEDVSVLEDDLLDLEPALRDAVVLALPFQPLCQPDCPGLCPECGVRLADEPGHAHEAAIDPRWSALQGLTDED